MIKRICFLLSLLMCGVLYAQDITYRTVKDLSYSSSKDPYATERCKLDVYYPENKTGCPVVVWFHGGGLTQGNKSIPGRLKKNGMVVIAVNYRPAGSCQTPHHTKTRNVAIFVYSWMQLVHNPAPFRSSRPALKDCPDIFP